MPVPQHDQGDHQQVWVQNDSHDDVIFKWAGNVYTVPAGGGRVQMPYNAMKVTCGDPKAVDREDDKARRGEFYRVRGKFGVGGHNERELKALPGRLPYSGLPDIKVFTLQGEPIPTPLADPEGQMIATASIDGGIAAQIEALQREVAELRSGQPAADPEPFDADVDYDGPPADILDPEPRAGEPPVDKPKPRKPKAGTIKDGKLQTGALTP